MAPTTRSFYFLREAQHHKMVPLRPPRLCATRKPRHEFTSHDGNIDPEDDENASHQHTRKNQYRRPKRPRKQQQPQRQQQQLDEEESDQPKVEDLLERILQLEQLASAQQVQIRQLQDKVEDWSSIMGNFSDVLDLMRKSTNVESKNELPPVTKTRVSEGVAPELDGIFATAPTTIHDAADAAGAAILAGLLAGKQRMLVDVRDAELANPEMLVQFIELAVLPVAAGLEGLRSRRNRLKICFSKVSDLLMYRKSMALAAPDVVALSTLGFDPVEQRDNLVVIVAPGPNDDEGLIAMDELLSTSLNQPVVVLNHHMVPIAGEVVQEFEVAYHLRLLSVQYVAGGDEDEEALMDLPQNATADEALEAAMQHAHQTGKHSGVTRAMVVRAYPRPWHVFVDTSPDTDADFSIAATFDDVPSMEEINYAIVECLEGSEEEDDIVKQQMQDALDSGQLDRVTDMLWSMGLDKLEENENEEGNDEDEDDDDIYRDMFGEDSV